MARQALPLCTSKSSVVKKELTMYLKWLLQVVFSDHPKGLVLVPPPLPDCWESCPSFRIEPLGVCPVGPDGPAEAHACKGSDGITELKSFLDEKMETQTS